MNKPIINGIDVSECKYLNKVVNEEPYCNIDEEHLYTCSSDENCYYKQLKRLQQEIDIKEKMLDKFMIGSGEILEKLQKENEELKEKRIINDIDKLDGMVKIKGKCGYEFIGGCRELRKYKQALKKIRNIAEKLITETPEYHSCYYKDECGDNCTPEKQSKVEYCCYENVDKILTLIDEVLNDRNDRD